jgi:crotonobetainyl-CoA:carnitine CoA-transferase CaiB-like acyl-CoA transferase
MADELMDTNKDQMLAGVKVLDISNLIAGPGIATNLADYGADVIKVEHPRTGDLIRNWGEKKNGIPLAWKAHGRGKRLLAVDLNTKEGQDIVKKLASQVDIVIESYRPGKLEEWGLGYETLSANNPKLILLRVSGWGQTGPYKNRPGFGTLAEASSGFAHITGLANGPPTLPSIPLADAIAAMTGTYAVMMALYHRVAHGGVGQVIDVSLLQAMFALVGPMAVEYDQLGIVQNRFGNGSPRGVPRNAYQTSDGRWVAISAHASDMSARLFRAIGRGEMVEDPRYNTNTNRLKHRAEVDGVIADWIGSHPLREVLDTLQQFEVPAAPVNDIAQIMADPHFQARKAVIQVNDEDLGPVRMPNIPVEFSRTPGNIRHPGRTAIGCDSVEILKSIGMNEEQIEQLVKKQIVAVPARKAAAKA